MKTSRILPLCILLCSLFSGFGARAQQVPEKDLMVLELFVRNRTVPRAYAEAIRGQVGAALEHRGRFRIADAGMEPGAVGVNDLVDPLAASSVLNDYLASRTPDMQQAEVRYALTGAVTDYKFEHVMLPADDKHPPVPGFRSTFMILLGARDYRLGKPLGQEAFTLSASAPIAEDADRMAIGTLAGKLIYYIDRNFRFETSILQLCEPEGRKQVVKELYIHSGIEMGVTAGDTFDVYEELLIGGVPTRELIGRVRVNDVHDEAIARCKITKGGDRIIRAIQSGHPLVCVSDTKALFF